MNLKTDIVREFLNAFDLRRLFIEVLGWDNHRASFSVNVNDSEFELTGIAEKHGVQIFRCGVDHEGKIPDYNIRLKIERQVRKYAHEHLIVFIDRDHTRQVWQWVARNPGKPMACREYPYLKGGSADALIHRLQSIAFKLSEEEGLDITGVTFKLRDAFDKDKVTKKFYDRFKKEHSVFLKFIEGIPIEKDKRWYASVMFSRLMFIYFIQKKGLLGGNPNYLRDKLEEIKSLGGNKYYSDFLCPLFFEGFAKKRRSRKTIELLGNVPYLNGGIFQKHEVEQIHGNTLKIKDEAFDRIFAYFDGYRWYLDERPLREQNEINPDVLGYIFEKYINQKDMGAYYTKEDITGYISKNTIVPRLFDSARKKCKIAFEGEQSVWQFLKSDPEKYIYPAIKKGVNIPLPKSVANGIDDVSQRTDWNLPASPEYALPTEIWREVVARRERYYDIRMKLSNGEINDINDMITYNLDIKQFAQDVIENCEGPDLLRAFWKSIESVTILDPTCGSGAFLFAALNILDTLYETCLDRMQAFIDDLEMSGQKKHPEKYKDFRAILKKIEEHPNRQYFILKSIILNNLYGVDIMEEAIEICKLRLFLKLVAQIEIDEGKYNWGIEPLPDIDFNIRSGNTLVGYSSLKEAEKAVTGKLDFDNTWDKINKKAAELQQVFDEFRRLQLDSDGSVPAESKTEVQSRLKALNNELSYYLANEYGIKPNKQRDYSNWLASHKPFHWFIEFYRIMSEGGFDVIIGNPPYVEYHKVKKQYVIVGCLTIDCGNLYAFIIERCLRILNENGRFGMIVQNSIVSTNRMESIQKLLLTKYNVHISNFDDRPAKLFTGIHHMKASIIILNSDISSSIFTTTFYRWYDTFRPHLFEIISYCQLSDLKLYPGHIAKISFGVEKDILSRIHNHKALKMALDGGKYEIYCHRIASYFIKSTDYAPYFWNEISGLKKSEDYKIYRVSNPINQSVIMAILNSGVFYYFWHVYGDGYHCGKAQIEEYPITLSLNSKQLDSLVKIATMLSRDYRLNSARRITNYKSTGKVIYDELFPKKSKEIIDRIDRELAYHYGFTAGELDFIVNYNIKYRMGYDNLEESTV